MKLLAFAVRVALISAVIVMSPVITTAVPVQDVPALRPHSWVTDSINILSPQTEAEINRIVDQLEAKNSCEIMVVTVPETKGYSSPREFALAWFNYWTIGKKGLDNGVLLMYSRGDDRPGETPLDRIEIVTGWGLKSGFPDAEVVSLIQRDIRPRLNKRDYNGAMLTGTQEVVKVLQDYSTKASFSRPQSLLDQALTWMVLLTALGGPFITVIYVICLFIRSWGRSSHSHNGSTGGFSGGGGFGGGGGGGHGGGGGGGHGGGGGGG